MNQPRTDWEEDAEAGEAKDRGLRAYFGHPGSRYGAALTGVVLLVGSAAYSLFGGDDLPPPLLLGDDVISILPLMDAVLLVTAVGTTTTTEIKECQKHLQRTPIVRVVVNKAPESHSTYYGYY